MEVVEKIRDHALQKKSRTAPISNTSPIGQTTPILDVSNTTPQGLSFVLIELRKCNFLVSPLNAGASRTFSCAQCCARFRNAAIVLIVTTCLCGCRSLLVFTSGTSNLFAIGRVETVGQNYSCRGIYSKCCIQCSLRD